MRTDDAEILQFAINQDRVLITLDQDFGDWLFMPLRSHPGVIRVRVHPAVSEGILSLLIPFLKSIEQMKLRDHLVILSKSGQRWVRTA